MRAQVVVLRGDRILMARHERPGHSFWVLPGGEIESEETPEEAAVREALEETGLHVRVERLLFVDGPRQEPGISIREPRHTFLASVVDGALEWREDAAGRAGKGRLAGCAWMPFDEPSFDAATRDTLGLVRRALGAE